MTKTNTPRNVLIDVENTLSVPFISGIQRVTRELVRELTRHKNPAFNFIPAFYCSYCDKWIKSDSLDTAPDLDQSLSIRRSKWIKDVLPAFIVKTVKMVFLHVQHLRSGHSQNCVVDFGEAPVFLDIDSSWHNSYKRSKLLPHLVEQGFTIATLHHDAIPVLMPELSHPNTVKVFSDHFHAHLQYSSLFICNSKATKLELLQFLNKGSPPTKAETIRFGDFEPSENPTNAGLVPDSIDDFLLYVATIEPRKNHSVLLDVFDWLSRAYPNLGLVLVGRNGWQSDETAKRISKHPLVSQRLFWFEQVSDDVLSYLYSHAFLSVIPSLYEGFGLPVSESLNHGCVTLCSNRGAIPEAGGEFVDYFEPNDRDKLFKLIQDYLQDSDRYLQRKNTLQQRESYSWKNTAHELVQLLDRNFRSFNI